MEITPTLAWSDDGRKLWQLDLSGRLSSCDVGRACVPQQCDWTPTLASLRCVKGGQTAAQTNGGNLLSGRLGESWTEVKLPAPVARVSLDSEGNRFCALAEDRSQIWCGRLQTLRPDWLLEGDYANIAPVWSEQPDWDLHLATLEKKRVAVYRDGDVISQSCAWLASPPEVACWSPCSPLLAIGQNNGDVVVLDALSGRVMATQVCEQPIRRLFWETNGRKLLVGSSERTWLLSLSGKRSEINVANRREVPYVAHCGAYRPKSTVFAAGSRLGQVYLARAAGRAELKVVHNAETSIEALAWSPSGKRLAFSDGSGRISVIRVCR